MKIAVIGYGFVGKAMVAAFDRNDDLDYIIVDPAYEEHHHDLDIVESCDAVVICVPTPEGENGRCDDSIVWSVVRTIGIDIPILIKSTVDIETLAFLKEHYPNVCFSPEFLRGRSSVEDFLQETKMIIGGEISQCESWANLFGSCVPIKDEAFLDIVEAGYVKYAENSFLAMRVTFFNDLWNLMQDAHPDLDYDSTVYALGLDPRIGHSHNEVPGYDGMFGWGGHCLPKDTAAFVNFADRQVPQASKDSALPLIKSVIEINKKHRK